MILSYAAERGLLFLVIVTVDFHLHDQKSMGSFLLVDRLHTKSEVDHMISSADML